jgi:hypothetical protein
MKKPNIKTIAIAAFITMSVTLSIFFILLYGVTK